MKTPSSSALAVLCACLGGCSIPSGTATIDLEAGIGAPGAPASENAPEWHPVADYLDHRCGSLDCHGDTQRNLIIYGCHGLRLDGGVPGCPPPQAPQATPQEYAATYESLVGLEPEVMSQVIADHGQDPDMLTFIRKARGEEAHKGGTLIDAGDVQDECLTMWLAGNPDAGADAAAPWAAVCKEAIATTP
jgi:hypothetical protein